MIRDIISHSAGSFPSEAHSGGWEGLGEDGGEPAPYYLIERNIFTHHGIKNAYEVKQSSPLPAHYVKSRSVKKK